MPTIVPTITTSDPNVFVANLTKFGTFAKRIQIDASDGSFAPNNLVPLTAMQPAQFPQGVAIDIHLMSARPSEHLPAILALKPSLCILHAEVDDNLAAVFAQLKQAGIKTGIAFIKATFPGRVQELIKTCDHAMIFAGALGSQGGTAVPTSAISAPWPIPTSTSSMSAAPSLRPATPLRCISLCSPKPTRRGC